jgi:hypothetical protein
MKPLSKYHHNIFAASHKNELASTVGVNKQRTKRVVAAI